MTSADEHDTDADRPPARAEEHLTDKADMEVRATGANEPIQGSDPQLRPGDVGDEDEAPTEVGTTVDGSEDERQALIDRVEDEREAD